MTRIRRWKNLQGVFSTELAVCDDDGDALPCFVQDALGVDVPELVIEFHSTGVSDPGQLCGPPESCYPPEHSEERTLKEAYIEMGVGENKKRIDFTPEQQDDLFSMYESCIELVELDMDDLC